MIFAPCAASSKGASRSTRFLTLTSVVLSVSAASLSPVAAQAAHHHKSSASSEGSASRHHRALVRVSTAKLRSAPDSSSHTAALLDEGRDAKVVGHKNGWVKLRLDSGREGWVRHDLVDVDRVASRDSREESSDDAPRHGHSRHVKQVEEIADREASRSSRRHAHPVRHVEEVAEVSHSSHHAHHSAPATTIVTTSIADNGGSDSSTSRVEASDDSTVASSDGATLIADSGETSPRAERLVNRALAYRGTPYRMGATGNGAFDCSGFTQYLFGSEGTSLPRTAAEQYEHGRRIPKDELQPGDLVFFKNTYKSGVSHVGIYIGNGSFVHASSGHGGGVTVTRLSDAYYVNHWAGARRPR